MLNGVTFSANNLKPFFHQKAGHEYLHKLHQELVPLLQNHHPLLLFQILQYHLKAQKYAYAVGETGCNGVHGANRLASNSLLESLVFAKRAVQKIMAVSSKSSKVRKNTESPAIIPSCLQINSAFP